MVCNRLWILDSRFLVLVGSAFRNLGQAFEFEVLGWVRFSGISF